jgi:hypothetical protein
LNLSAQYATPTENADGTLGVEFGNGYIEVDPSYGGRVSSLKIDGHEMLYLDKEYGGGNLWGATLWQSPQSEWGWPPSTALDSDPYTGGIIGNTISLLSDIDGDYGTDLQFRKIFYAIPADTSVIIRYTLINTGSTDHEYSAWELTRVPVGGITFFPYGDGGSSGDFADEFVKEKNVAWYKYKGTEAPSQKYFCDGSEGWYAFLNDSNELYIRRTKEVPSDKQAPDESENELWFSSTDSYLELEIQSEYTDILSEDSLVWDVKWYVRNLPDSIVAEVGNQNLIDYVRNVIKSNPVIIGIENPTIADFNVYPNPASKYISVKTDRKFQKPIFLKIYNLQGKLVKFSKITLKSKVDVSMLKEGMYIYTISEGTTSVSKGKLIIKR